MTYVPTDIQELVTQIFPRIDEFIVDFFPPHDTKTPKFVYKKRSDIYKTDFLYDAKNDTFTVYEDVLREEAQEHGNNSLDNLIAYITDGWYMKILTDIIGLSTHIYVT